MSLNEDPCRGRPVIYLDQRDWSMLAQTIHEPDRIASASQRAAAAELITWAQAGRVILPFSMGHVAETAQRCDDVRRYQTGLTIATLSRGWRMVNPLDVRKWELLQIFARQFQHHAVPVPVVFTLTGGAIETQSRDQSYQTRWNDEEWPAGLGILVRGQSDTLSHFSLLLSETPIFMESVPGWAAENQMFTDAIGGDRTLKESSKQLLVEFRFHRDLANEMDESAQMARAQIAELEDWLVNAAAQDLKTAPAIGLFGAVYQNKHLDRSTRWEFNDMIDLMYLTTAAAYADFVLGEKSTVNQMRQAARRLGRPMNMFATVEELVATVRTSGRV